MNWYKTSEDIPEGAILQWEHDIERDIENNYNKCPYKNLDRIKEAVKRAVIKWARNSPDHFYHYIYPWFVPDELKETSGLEIQDALIEGWERLIASPGLFSNFSNLYGLSKEGSFFQRVHEKVMKYLADIIKQSPDVYYKIRSSYCYNLINPDLKNDLEEIVKQLGINPINQDYVNQWISIIIGKPDEYKHCPYKDIKEVREVAIQSVIKHMIKNPAYVFTDAFPFELLDSPEVQDIFGKQVKERIVDNLKYGTFGFSSLYYQLKSTSLGQKLRRDLIKILFYKIKENPNIYYAVRKNILDPDLCKDFENIAKHLKLPIKSPIIASSGDRNMWYKRAAIDEDEELFKKQNFYRYDTYGPRQDKTVFFATQNDSGEKAIYIINGIEGSELQFSNIKMMIKALKSNIAYGAYYLCTKDDVIKWFKDNPNYVW